MNIILSLPTSQSQARYGHGFLTNAVYYRGHQLPDSSLSLPVLVHLNHGAMVKQASGCKGELWWGEGAELNGASAVKLFAENSLLITWLWLGFQIPVNPRIRSRRHHI